MQLMLSRTSRLAPAILICSQKVRCMTMTSKPHSVQQTYSCYHRLTRTSGTEPLKLSQLLNFVNAKQPEPTVEDAADKED